jgi:hypothetical protein
VGFSKTLKLDFEISRKSHLKFSIFFLFTLFHDLNSHYYK